MAEPSRFAKAHAERKKADWKKVNCVFVFPLTVFCRLKLPLRSFAI
jgi:hypothetical protein